MNDLKAIPEIERYLKSVAGSSAHILKQSHLAKPGTEDVKGYGYGTPVLIEYEVEGKRQKAVLHTVKPGPFGHEHMADRAQSLLWDHAAFNTLPKHVRSLDVGAFRHDGTPDRTMVSLGDAEEFFTLTTYGEGKPYAEDLERMRDSGDLGDTDVQRADALCDYLSEIHQVRGGEPGLYVRRIRELVGHSECIMGLIDSYPAGSETIPAPRLAAIEKRCIDWRWRLKNRVHRLRQVHGDFHPWNILFNTGGEICVLDRSRGEWGDPADDVTCLTMNYLFFSLQRSGSLEGHFETLFRNFWQRYLRLSGDEEMLEVAAPFLVFRGLVMAHPVWYPQLHDDVRMKLFNFMEGVLNAKTFDPENVNGYCNG
jgi:aminoglycoside phosphotransferase (APT) family kinase protein